MRTGFFFSFLLLTKQNFLLQTVDCEGETASTGKRGSVMFGNSDYSESFESSSVTPF